MKKKKSKILKYTLVLIIMSIVVVVTLVIVNYRKVLNNPEKIITALNPGADMTIDNIHQTATRGGKKEWQLEAESAHYTDADKKVHLDVLDMVFFTERHKEIQLTADSGILETESQNVNVKGRVKLSSDDVQLRTDELRYRHAKRVIFADSPVTITGETFKLSAEGLTLDIEKGKAVLKGNVRATFDDDFTL